MYTALNGTNMRIDARRCPRALGSRYPPDRHSEQSSVQVGCGWDVIRCSDVRSWVSSAVRSKPDQLGFHSAVICLISHVTQPRDSSLINKSSGRGVLTSCVKDRRFSPGHCHCSDAPDIRYLHRFSRSGGSSTTDHTSLAKPLIDRFSDGLRNSGRIVV